MARILVISNFYPPHHYGGYELCCFEAVQSWRRNGHQVTVLTSSATQPGSVTPPHETREDVRRELQVAVEAGRLVSIPRQHRLARERDNLSSLSSALDDTDPHIVSVWHMLGVPLGLITAVAERRIPMVCVVNDEWPVYIQKTDPWSASWPRSSRIRGVVQKLTGVPTIVPNLDAAASFCFCSNFVRQKCINRSPWNFTRSAVIYSGINTEEFPVTRQPRRDSWNWRLLTAGRLDPHKGFATAISSLSFLPREATLEILSPVDGPYRQVLEAEADRQGLGARVAFSVSDRSALRERYLAADAVIFPSEWDEPFGMVPIEAMACGVPVVATATGGSSEFLADGRNCLVYPPGNAKALAESLIRLSKNVDTRRQLTAGGWEVAEELTSQKMADHLEAWHLAAIDDFVGGQPEARELRYCAPRNRELDL